MVEYIKQSAAIIAVDYATDEHPYDKTPGQPDTWSEYNQGWHDACDFIRDNIERLIADDVVRAVRCKDCKHAKFSTRCSRYWCDKSPGVMTYSNDYCSYGVRKEIANDR